MNKLQKEKKISKLKDFFKRNASQYHIDISFLYGSWATGEPGANSDIDIGILFSPEIDTDEIFSLITDISYELEKDSDREVNIIALFRDFRHPMLYYNTIVLGMPIFIKDNDKFLELKLEAIYQMEDFQIFGIFWQQEIARKNIKEITHA
jgi:predicted nucleotidyltransferase